MQANKPRLTCLVNVLTVAVLAACGSGCADVCYREVQLDSRLPAEAVPCMAPAFGQLHRMQVNAPCYVQVRADLRITRVPIAIEARQRYRLTLLDNQVWYDKTHRSATANGVKGSALMEVFNSLKQDETLKWMALKVAVVSHNAGVERIEEQQALVDGSSCTFTHAGQLAFFPNDARYDYFYKNNRGVVWVEVVRESDDSAASESGCGDEVHPA